LEILDFDEPEYFWHWQAFIEDVDVEALTALPIVESPSGGYHVYYRCQEIAGNQKLAQAGARRMGDRIFPGKTRIETRGEGGYVVTPASPGACHPSGQPYRLIRGHLWHIPTIRPETRALFLRCARAFNEVVNPPKAPLPHRVADDAMRAGDVFAAMRTWDDILLPHGWQRDRTHGDTTSWTRPGKTLHDGQSATTGHGGHDVFYVFSTNAAPFEAPKGYSKFTVHVLLNYRGDYHAAAQAVWSEHRRRHHG
jgi:putative DNA primase/helicase